MITNNINTFVLLSNTSGFGINTDVFETNILNLSVVIGVLIYYGRLVLGDIIKSRKELIMKNLQDAESKLREAEENLAFAKKNFETAKSKADQIRQQGTILAAQTSKTLLEAIDDDIKRLKSVNLSTIKMEEEKSINEVCQKLSHSAFLKAVDDLDKRLNPSLHKKIIFQNIEKLSFKTLANK